MPVAIAESIYLILDARAVARTYAFYLSRKKRRFVEIRADNLVRSLVGVGDVAGQLRRREVPRAEAKRDGICVALLDFKHAKIDAFSVHSGAGSRF